MTVEFIVLIIVEFINSKIGGSPMRLTEIDRVTEWLRKNTTIVKILEQKISRDRLKRWSDVLRLGHFNRGYHEKGILPPDIEIREDLVTFIDTEASTIKKDYPELADVIYKNPDIFELSPKIHRNKDYMKDPFRLAVICGIRALQEKEGFGRGKGIINFIRYRENKELFV